MRSSTHCRGSWQEVNQPGSRPRPNTPRAPGARRRVGGVHRVHRAQCACYFLVESKNRHAHKLILTHEKMCTHIDACLHTGTRQIERQTCTCAPLSQTFLVFFHTPNNPWWAVLYTYHLLPTNLPLKRYLLQSYRHNYSVICGLPSILFTPTRCEIYTTWESSVILHFSKRYHTHIHVPLTSDCLCWRTGFK